MLRKALHWWSKYVVRVGSFEWLLNYHANGGSVISLRTLLISGVVYLFAIVVKDALDPGRIFRFNSDRFLSELAGNMQWFGALFAAVYAGLYSRFASQWLYLAGLYNTIKQTEAQVIRNGPESKAALADWKAGFMEDANELHLATKSVFVSVINAWGNDEAVKKAFVKNTPDGQRRYDALMADVIAAYAEQDGLTCCWLRARRADRNLSSALAILSLNPTKLSVSDGHR